MVKFAISRVLGTGATKKQPVEMVQVFCEDKNSKIDHNLKENRHMSPSLDNEFLLVARTMQKCFLKICFIV